MSTEKMDAAATAEGAFLAGVGWRKYAGWNDSRQEVAKRDKMPPSFSSNEAVVMAQWLTRGWNRVPASARPRLGFANGCTEQVGCRRRAFWAVDAPTSS